MHLEGVGASDGEGDFHAFHYTLDRTDGNPTAPYSGDYSQILVNPCRTLLYDAVDSSCIVRSAARTNYQRNPLHGKGLRLSPLLVVDQSPTSSFSRTSVASTE